MSKRSWTFEPGDSANLLINKIQEDTFVEVLDLALVLGSGWSGVSCLGETLASYAYSDWPCFPAGQIKGHGGYLHIIRFASWNVLVFSGRFHCYQDLSAFEASFPVRLAGAMGCQRVLLTCATGAINDNYQPGEFMLVDDHINLLGDNPLRGITDNPFVDMTGAYLHKVYDLCFAEELEEQMLHRGILAAMPGPSYETPAEIKLLRTCGADVVSMSTVHETIMARYLNMRVAAIAFISNFAAGISRGSLSHADVLDCSEQHAGDFPLLVSHIISAWQKAEPAVSIPE